MIVVVYEMNTVSKTAPLGDQPQSILLAFFFF